jgi:ABC-type multidrug transport system ATPase subunit
VKPIRYRIGDRIADWYHGLRDGWAGIPDRDTTAEYITTPHRESLIQLAMDVFERERLEYERERGDAPKRIAAATAKLDQLRAHQAEVERQLSEASRPLTADQERWRRIGDLQHPEQVVVQRRRTEHRRRANAIRVTLNSILAETGRVRAELDSAKEFDQRALQAATSRVRRFHSHTRRRLDCYLRRLIRSHPDGAWASTYLIIPSFLPGWIGQVPSPPEDPQTTAGPEPPPPQPGARAPRVPASLIPLQDQETIFGSDLEKADVRITAAGTAPRHFALTRDGDQLLLRDFGHGHGPYRFGKQVRSDLLKPNDYFDFADRRYYVMPGCRELEDTPLGPVTLIVDGLRATTAGSGGLVKAPKPPRELLSGMSFVQREDTLLAVLGPSGAGKSSLFSALIGDLIVDRGSLYLADIDMLGQSPQIRDMLGYVPQLIELHTALTVRQLLTYSFHLRDPGTSYNRNNAIDSVCAALDLRDQQNQLVSTLSGGQSRRVSIAIELLSQPALLILDEPTSGLDPGKDRAIMSFLRNYATDRSRARPARTVIVSTHSTEHLRESVNEILILADHGQPIFLGRAEEALTHFDAQTWAELMTMLEPVDGRTNPAAAALAQKYQLSGRAAEAHEEAHRAAARLAGRPAAGKPGAIRSPSPQWVRWRSSRVFLRQLWTLIKRQVTLLRVRGRKNGPEPTLRAGLVALLPFLVGAAAAVLAAQITPHSGLSASRGSSASIALTVLTTLAVLSGQALTYGDLVADFPIIRREHRTGVLLPSVTLSKWLVYLAVAAIQAAIVTATFIVAGRRPGPAYSNVLWPPAELFIDLAALTIAAMSLGLLISALAAKLEQAVAMVTLTSITQIALNGLTAPLSPGLNIVAVLLPDRWGTAAAASSVDLDQITLPPPRPADALWQHTTGRWAVDLIALALLTLSYLALATLVLHRRLRPQAPRPLRMKTARRRS